MHRKYRQLSAFILRHRMLIFMLLSFFLLIIFPLVEQQNPKLMIAVEIIFNMMLLAGIYLVSPNKQMVIIGTFVILMALSIIGFNQWIQSKSLFLTGMGLECIILALTCYSIIRHVLSYKRVTADKIYGAISAYLLTAILWGMFYTMIEIASPESFKFNHGLIIHTPTIYLHRLYFSQFLYYSFVTMSTLGYGDIVPIGGYARLLASLQCVFGQLYVATLVARLVGLQISHMHEPQHHDK